MTKIKIDEKFMERQIKIKQQAFRALLLHTRREEISTVHIRFNGPGFILTNHIFVFHNSSLSNN